MNTEQAHATLSHLALGARTLWRHHLEQGTAGLGHWPAPQRPGPIGDPADAMRAITVWTQNDAGDPATPPEGPGNEWVVDAVENGQRVRVRRIAPGPAVIETLAGPRLTWVVHGPAIESLAAPAREVHHGSGGISMRPAHTRLAWTVRAGSGPAWALIIEGAQTQIRRPRRH